MESLLFKRSQSHVFVDCSALIVLSESDSLIQVLRSTCCLVKGCFQRPEVGEIVRAMPVQIKNMVGFLSRVLILQTVSMTSKSAIES